MLLRSCLSRLSASSAVIHTCARRSAASAASAAGDRATAADPAAVAAPPACSSSFDPLPDIGCEVGLAVVGTAGAVVVVASSSSSRSSCDTHTHTHTGIQISTQQAQIVCILHCYLSWLTGNTQHPVSVCVCVCLNDPVPAVLPHLSTWPPWSHMQRASRAVRLE